MPIQMTNSVSGEQLRAYVERYERLEQEKKDIAEEQKLVLQEAKSAGYNTKIIRHCIKVRKMGAADYHEAQALADMYLAALGMAVDPPLFRAANLIGVDTAAKESVIEALKRFVPDNGSILIEAGGVPVRLTRDPDGNVAAVDVVHRPAPEPSQGGAGSPAPSRQAAPPADIDGDQAEELGRQAAKSNVAIIKNPFPFGDPRRPRWDVGWRAGAGNDGMGPQ